MAQEIALIVGSGPELSASLARLFRKEGMNVALSARNVDKLNGLVKEIGGRAYACDASSPSDVKKLFQSVSQDIGDPNVFVYNASGRVRGPVTELDPEEVRQTILVTCYGGFLTPSNYRQNAELSPDNIDFDMIFETSTSGLDSQLRSGLFDYAQMWTFKINWEDPSTTTGIVKLAHGRLGEVEIQDNQAKIELRTLTQQLSLTIGNIYTPQCRTYLGTTDQCKIYVTSTVYTRTGTISDLSTFTDNRQFIVLGDAAGQIDDFFSYGKITFSGVANNGITLQIENYTTLNVVSLIEPAPYSLSAGDTFTAIAGCDRRWETCKTRFSNKDNFRGFPH